MSSDQIPSDGIPWTPEIEEACLGALLTNPNAYATIAQHIGKEDFFLLRHQWIWEAVQRIIERGLEFDYLTVGQELSDLGHLDEVGSIPYLMRLINNTPTSVHGELYAMLIKSSSTRRKLLAAGDRVKALAADESLELDTVRELVQTEVQSAIGKSMFRRSRTIQDLLSELITEVETRIEAHKRGEAIMGISSGWHDVDKINYGWLPGQLIYIAGRPGSGKTTFAVNTMINAVRKHQKVWAWLGEQSAMEIIRRVAVREARASKVQIRDILNGTVTSEQYSELLLSIPRHERSRLIIDDTPGITLSQMKAETMALKARGQLDLIFVDRIELMSVPGLDGRPDKETAKISYLSTGLKQLARLLDVPLLCCIQLNRKVEERQDKRPVLSDLRMSGSTEQDADLVLMLYRDEYYYPDTTETPNIMEVITRKHRDGRLGTAYLFTDFAAMDLLPARFEQVDLADRVQFNKDRAPLHNGGNDD